MKNTVGRVDGKCSYTTGLMRQGVLAADQKRTCSASTQATVLA
jgi:hypothetical protein